jgi:hypothetical protein
MSHPIPFFVSDSDDSLTICAKNYSKQVLTNIQISYIIQTYSRVAQR